MQFEERFFQSQFSISADKLYEWNIDDLLEQEIINKMGHMSMFANAYITNHNLDHAEIVDLLTIGFLEPFMVGGKNILPKSLENPSKMLLKWMMMVYSFLMKELVKVFLMESIL